MKNFKGAIFLKKKNADNHTKDKMTTCAFLDGLDVQFVFRGLSTSSPAYYQSDVSADFFKMWVRHRCM